LDTFDFESDEYWQLVPADETNRQWCRCPSSAKDDSLGLGDANGMDCSHTTAGENAAGSPPDRPGDDDSPFSRIFDTAVSLGVGVAAHGSTAAMATLVNMIAYTTQCRDRTTKTEVEKREAKKEKKKKKGRKQVRNREVEM
jgi:hypothetical protein